VREDVVNKALIVGGGIAGPVAAMALQRAGIESVVYEAYAASAGLTAGSFLSVAVNGLAALRAVDAHEPVTAAGFPSKTIVFYSGTGKRLGEVPIGGQLPDGTVTHTLMRADLYRVVNEEAVRRGIRIEHGKRLVGAEAVPGGVVARLEDGTEATGDVLIGADGTHSRTRRIIDPGAPGPHYTGLGNVGGLTREAVVDAPPGTYAMIWGKRCFFGYTVSPAGEVWWFANPPRTREITREELSGTTNEQWKAHLIDLFAGDSTPAAAIIRATSEPIAVTNQFDLPSVPVWHRGPMVLIGDAAHAVAPSSGQGVSQAAEDAVVLARCLRDLPDPERAFSAFEELRRERVERVVAFGRKYSGTKTAGPFARVVRDLVLPFLLQHQASPASQDWLFGYRVDFGAPVEVGVVPRAA
jgi:2-polyprenyl-6-methoxyphenol hydroxylase-like FAD-dependent oxidoreductase